MRQDTSHERHRGIGWKVTWWLSLVLGAVLAIEGLFILAGPEDEYVGVGGDLAWQVGEISSAWTYGLLVVGFGLLALWLAMVVTGRRLGPIETTPMSEFLFHAGAFILVNAYLWIQDIALDSGLDYAYVTTLAWGVGLAFHGWHVLRETGDHKHHMSS